MTFRLETLDTPTPTLADTEKALRVPMGLASPLWMMFAGAASAGVAFWWISRWRNFTHLEALLPVPEPESPQALLAAPVEPVVEPVVEPAPEPVMLEAAVEPVVSAAAEPVVEVLEPAPFPEAVQEAVPAEAPTESVVAAEPEAPVSEVLAAEPAAPAHVEPAKPASKPKTSKAKAARAD